VALAGGGRKKILRETIIIIKGGLIVGQQPSVIKHGRKGGSQIEQLRQRLTAASVLEERCSSGWPLNAKEDRSSKKV